MPLKTTLRTIVASVLLVIVICPAFAQLKPVSIPVSADQKWEYIVVSYGKTEFGAPQKTLAYRPIGLLNGQEAQDLQNSLDILGRFGWEAVAFVGSIGGDQQIVLKRKYDKNRIVSERESIARGTELYIKDMADILEREQSLRDAERLAEEEARNKPHLIDLDSEDEEAAKAARLVAFRNFYNEGFKNSELSQTSTITIEYSNASSGDINVVIRTDLTKRFLKDDGKSYRGKEVYQFLKSGVPLPNFSSELLARSANVKITAVGFIQFQDKSVDVALYLNTYSSILGKWSGYF
jgi:hypothetical protein